MAVDVGLLREAEVASAIDSLGALAQLDWLSARDRALLAHPELARSIRSDVGGPVWVEWVESEPLVHAGGQELRGNASSARWEPAYDAAPRPGCLSPRAAPQSARHLAARACIRAEPRDFFTLGNDGVALVERRSRPVAHGRSWYRQSQWVWARARVDP